MQILSRRKIRHSALPFLSIDRIWSELHNTPHRKGTGRNRNWNRKGTDVRSGKKELMFEKVLTIIVKYDII